MRIIYLTQDQITIVDDKDYNELNKYRWHTNKNKKTYYPMRHIKKANGRDTSIRMHQQILGKHPKGFVADHIDGDGLNNQRHNLRFITQRQNSQNRVNVTSSSRHPGVCWYKKRGKWVASIRVKGRSKHLGCFTNEEEASQAYQRAVASLNEHTFA